MYKIFTITDQPFTAFILKLAKRVLRSELVYFHCTSKLENKPLYFHSDEQILDPLLKEIICYQQLYSEPEICLKSGQKRKEDNSDVLLFEGIRVTTVNHPFDSLTLSQELLEDTDTLIEHMDIVSKRMLFVCDVKELNENPGWFCLGSSNTIAAWLVAQFEARVRYL